VQFDISFDAKGPTILHTTSLQNGSRILPPNSFARVDEKAVKGSHGENLGVPVVNSITICFIDLGRRETFHSCANIP
jgi:hypothetical protein